MLWALFGLLESGSELFEGVVDVPTQVAIDGERRREERIAMEEGVL